MIIKYKSGKDFFQDNIDILLSDEIKYSLTIHNAKVLYDFKMNSDNYAIKVSTDNHVLLAIRSYPHPLVITGSPYCIGELCKALDKYRMVFAGIIGSPQITEAFINQYCKKHRTQFKVRLALNQMIFAGKGKLCDNIAFCSKEDIPVVTDFIIAFYQECFGEKIDNCDAKEKADNFIGKTLGYYISSELAAVVKMGRETARYVNISFVYTKPKYRSRGYMQALMLHICKLIQDNNKTPILYVDIANPVSNHIYKKIGFKIYNKDINYDLIV